MIEKEYPSRAKYPGFLIVSAVATLCCLPLRLSAQSAPSTQVCQTRANETPEKLLECIKQQALWEHLSQFQRIADENPGSDGHGNRDTGTSGYEESVDYVSGLMQQAGYRVTIQPYQYTASQVTGTPRFSMSDHAYVLTQDWFVARLSAGGTLTAPIQSASGSDSGCWANEFTGFVPGSIALLQRGACAYDAQVANAQDAGAAAVIIYNTPEGGAFPARLARRAHVPVVGVVSYAVGSDLYRRSLNGNAPAVDLDIRTRQQSGVDFNVIADSPFGDPNRVVVVDAHLDAIFGAGMLDNASGSTTILEIALNLAKTPTRNQLRYIWFGGEELGLLGSAYYATHLTQAERVRIAFDVDVDVTATPNFDYLVADPQFAFNVNLFPPNVVPESKVGNRFFSDFFNSGGVPSRPAWFGNDGTDSNSFSLIGIPNTGILTQQDCCKSPREVSLWGGFLGNYEGAIPSFNGGCVDMPGRFCDNLSNNDPTVLQLASQAAAFVTLQLANYPFPADFP